MRREGERNLVKCYYWAGRQYWADEKFIYVEERGELKKLALFDEHYYKLRMWKGVPILEIDGLRMHLINQFSSPLAYAKEVVEGLGAKGGKALDICAGLGYITGELIRKGCETTAIEKAEAVIALARHNPYSKALFESNLIIGDAYEILPKLKEKFDWIVHDPPRISHAPLLYSRDFYKMIKKCAKKGGKIYNYVGSVGKRKGREIWKEAKKRLESVGFVDIEYNERLQGLFFTAP